jgi:hypothetical protein
MTVPLVFTSLVASGVIAYFGRNRKLGFWGYFFASLLLTPLVGLLLVIISAPAKPAPAPVPPKNEPGA